MIKANLVNKKHNIPRLPIFSRWLTLIFLLCITAFRKADTDLDSKLIIRFRLYVHGQPLVLHKKYTNPFGEIFEINRFRFYTGKIVPVYTEAGRSLKTSAGYHLIDFSDSASTMITISVNAGSCKQIQFQLGIDSMDQVRGAQTGALDPAKGMFWTWNSGYQSFKIEGVSPVSDQPAHMIAYHIGGYRSPYSTVWKLKTPFENIIRFSKEAVSAVEIPIELDYFFDGPTPLRIQQISSCTTPGELAWTISRNFIASFTGPIIISKP